MPELDMSDELTSWLVITYPPTETVPERTRVKLDFDEVALQLQGQCSGMFADTSVNIGQIKSGLAKAFYDGNPTEAQTKELDELPDFMPANGLFVSIAYKIEGKQLPPEVPDYLLILTVVERVMKAPPGSSLKVKAKALWFFIEESMKRMNAKKDMPHSPESPALTPAL